MNERTGDQGAGTAAVPIGASEISRLPFGVEIETRSASDALTAVRGWAEDAAARSVRWRASDNFSFGIEEEYFVVDSATKAVVLTRPAQFDTARATRRRDGSTARRGCCTQWRSATACRT